METLAVVLLIQEEACLLSIDVIHGVPDAVLGDSRGAELPSLGGGGGLFLLLGAQMQGVTRIEPLVLLHALQLADGYVVAEVEGVDLRAELLAEDADEGGKEDILDFFNAERKHLRHQDVFKAIHRQPGEAVGLAEDETAALEVGLPHDGASVGHGVAERALPVGLVKAVVGVAGEETDADLGVAVVKARAQVLVFIGVNVHQPAVLGGGGEEVTSSA